MSKALSLLVLLLFSVLALATVPAFAQTKSASYTFGLIDSNSACSAFTSWNGVPNAYPLDNGIICFNLPGSDFVYSDMEIPFQLGFIDNGFFDSEPPFVWGPQVSTGPSTFTQTGNVSYRVPGGATIPVNFIANFLIQTHKSCYRGHCIILTTDLITGGSGTISQQ